MIKRLFAIVCITAFYITASFILLGYPITHALASQESDTPHAPLRLPYHPHAVADPIPRTGEQKLLVVLVDFPDKAGAFTGQAWRQFFFGAQGFSDYYQEISYHQLRYPANVGDVVGISNGAPVINDNAVAYVRLANPISYYADGQYGFKVGSAQFPKNNGGVVYHALQALDAANFNFAPYANPATNRVENLVVIFAGSNYGYTRDPNHSLEATAYNLVYAGGSEFVSQGGQHLNNYTFCPDQRGSQGEQARIGICTHEHGHALGMFDLYDFSFTTSGAGYFDLMSYGTYGGGEGERPFHAGAFSKQFFGWITPTLLLTGTHTVTLAPAEVTPTDANPQMIKLYPNGDANSKEYFLLENRQALGFDQDWATRKLCPGLLIWHVDQAIVNDYTGVNLVNTLATYNRAPPHPGVVIVEADGQQNMTTSSGVPGSYNYGDCSDTWKVGQSWNASTTPNSNLWDGRSSALSLQVLSEQNGALTLTIQVGDGTPVVFDHLLYLPVASR